jgi:ATP-dependent helicase/nuclease subunit A
MGEISKGSGVMSGHDLERWSLDQKKAILAKGCNVLVSAGAGSGKTSVLVERVVTSILYDPKIDVDELLVVTFTEAAAAEMLERIRGRLGKLLQVARESEDFPLMKRIITQLSRIDQAQISTLHSFCMDIVKRNFLALGLDPNFGLMNEEQAGELREEVAMKMIEEYLRDEDSSNRDSFSRMLTAFDANDPQKLLPILLRVDTFSESQPDPTRWLQQVAAAFIQDAHSPLADFVFATPFYGWILRLLDDAHDGLLHAMDLARGAEGLDSYLENMDAINVLLDGARRALNDTKDLAAVESQILACLSLKSPRAKADVPGKDEVSEIRKRVLETIKLLDEILGRGEVELVEDLALQSEAVHSLCEFAAKFRGRLMEAKRKAGKIQFSDLEHLAKQAISDERTGEQARLKTRFAAILVDEYQDTSPIQDAMIRLVVRDEGNLFTVGDVKQSIYRFRMAEPKLFIDEYESLGVTKPGEVINLSENYRSRKEIVDCVNFLFTQLFSEATTGFAYDERSQMKSGALYPPYPLPEHPPGQYPEQSQVRSLELPRLELHLIERTLNEEEEGANFSAEELTEVDPGDGSALDLSAIEKEAVVVGQRILDLLGNAEGQKRELIFDKSTRVYRPIECRDIVILLRSAKGRVRVFLDVLRAMGIPTSGNAGTGFYDSLEVQWLIALLNAIDNPRRELPFVTLLRSPFVGVSNEQLARIRTAGKGNYYDALLRVVHAKLGADSEDEEGDSWWRDERLVREARSFWKLFDGWRKLARRAPVTAVLNRIFSDTEFVHYVSGMNGGQVRKQNVESFLELARSYDESSADGVFGFVSKLEQLQKAGGNGQGSSLNGDDGNSVEIMTIHGSKGLEFPVVIIADLGKQFRGDKGETRFGLHRDLGIGPVFNDFQTNRRWKTVASIAIAELEKCESAAEEARVLYVAMTRARERLILVGSARNLNKLVERSVAIANQNGLCLSKSSFLSAKTYLDWIVPAFLRHKECRGVLLPLSGQPGQQIREWVGEGTEMRVGQWTEQSEYQRQNSDPRVIAESELNTQFRLLTMLWNHPDGQMLPVAKLAPAETSVHPDMKRNLDERGLVRYLQSLQSGASQSLLTAKVEIVDKIIEPSDIPSKVSATELRRLWVASRGKGNQRKPVAMHLASAAKLLASPRFAAASGVTAMEAGTAFHRLMQCIDFTVEPTINQLKNKILELCKASKLTRDEASQLIVEDVLGWLRSPLFTRIRNASVVYREQPFFHRMMVSESRYVIVQGVIDCLAQESNGWLIVDYKTDEITESLVEDKAKEYEAQVGAYIAAVHSTVKTDKLEAYLYFVKPRVSIRVKPMELSKVF